MGLLDSAGDLAVALGLAGGYEGLVGMYCDAVDVVGVAGVVTLSVRLEVVEDDDGGHVVDDLTRRQVVEVRIAVAVDLTSISVNPLELKLQRRLFQRSFRIPGLPQVRRNPHHDRLAPDECLGKLV